MSAPTQADVDRVRALVLQHALDPDDADELLAMLGLDDQAGTAPRTCSEQPARRSGTVHTVSAGTEARLAAHTVEPAPDPPAPPAPPRPLPPPPPPVEAPPPAEVVEAVEETPEPQAATQDPPQAPPTTDRHCVDCGVPVVTQTVYSRDPDGHRERGIKLIAAKERCFTCYRVYRRPAASDDELNRLTQALVQANTDLAEARAEAERQRTLAETPVDDEDLAELQRENDRLRAECQGLADLLAEVARERDMARVQLARVHRHAWQVQPGLKAMGLPCACGEPWPADTERVPLRVELLKRPNTSAEPTGDTPEGK